MNLDEQRERCRKAYRELAAIDPARYGGKFLEAQLRSIETNIEAGVLHGFAIRAEGLIERKRQRMASLNQLVRAPSEESGELVIAFKALADRWQRETGMLSSISKKYNHDAYQKIIALGKPVVPLILQELQNNPAYWFKALESITKASPIGNGQRVDLAAAAAAWIAWGKEMGYTK